MGSVLDGTAKTCEFYSSEEHPVRVDRVDGGIVLGDGAFTVAPMVEEEP